MASLDHLFAALSGPTRRAMVARLARGPARVTDIAERFPMSLNAVSKHVKVLERAGLVRRRRDGRESSRAARHAAARGGARDLPLRTVLEREAGCPRGIRERGGLKCRRPPPPPSPSPSHAS